jgi:2-methylisocitrate lyase-like PEP mutase family enzyme
MPTPETHAEAFAALHVPGRPLVLFNAWDAGSARAVAASGAAAIATGSWSVAAAHGYGDGERLPLDLVIANLERIVAAVELPVTLDLEGGYGATPQAVGETVGRVLLAGAIGFNLEDRDPEAHGLRTVAEQTARLRAARAAAERAGVAAFVNARTDVFLIAAPDTHGDAMVDTALERARAYADAGASGFFVPGLVEERLIAKVTNGTPLPVNVMKSPACPSSTRLAELGVARVSHGPGPYRQAMKALEEAARAALG